MKGIKFIHLNCCSIINKFDLISQTLLNESTIDFICFTESWLKPTNDSSLFKLHDYDTVRLDRIRPNRSGNYTHGGGILCYIRESLHYEVLPDPISTIDLEALPICLSPINPRKLYVIVVYRPPSGNIPVALNLITEMINKWKSRYTRQNFVILGDFNIDVQRKRNNPDREKFNVSVLRMS